MAGYTKLAGSILDSTVWVGQTAQTKVVWITILAMKDAVGEVFASVPGLAQRAGVTVEDCEKALAIFMSPDAYSRTKDHDGRRIFEIDGGWCVINHEKYKYMESIEQRREKAAARQKRFRERNVTALRSVTSNACNALSHHTDPDSDSDPDPDPEGESEAPAPVPATTGLRSGPVTGFALQRLFATVRARAVPGALPWTTPVMRDGKESSMAEIINADPSARSDVLPTMELMFRKAKDGKSGKNSKLILEKPAFGFACWVSDWTALREELRGKVASDPPKTRLELAQEAEAASWRGR